MKKILTFCFIVAICFFATPVFADGKYVGSCSCTSESGMILPGVCDEKVGCICGGSIHSNACVYKETTPNTNNNGGTTNNSNNNNSNNNSGHTTVDCGVIADITGPAAKLIMIAGPIILIVMGTVDILGVVTSGDEKSMSKAWSNLIKRFLICVVLLILPLLINFIIGWTTFKNLTACL